MKQATTRWSLVLSGIERSEASFAFRGSAWEWSWFENLSRFNDDDDSTCTVTIEVESLDILCSLLAITGKLNATWGAQLCCHADFESVAVNASLCTEDSGFLVSSCAMSESVGAVTEDIASKITAAETALYDLRRLVALRQIQS